MKRAKRVVEDPDFGPVEFEGSPPSRGEWEAAERQAVEAAKKARLWPAGSVSRCPNCGRPKFVGRDDLTHEVARPGGVVVFRHLRGGRCEACMAQSLEAGEILAMEEEVGVGVVPDYEAKVSNIGSGTVGTYWPRDVVRVLGLTPQTRAYIQVVDKDTAVIKFRRGRGSAPTRRRRPRRAD